jgi:hypothetical protein
MKIGGRCAPPPGKDLLTVWPGKMPQVTGSFSVLAGTSSSPHAVAD